MGKSVPVVENSACLHGCGSGQAGTQTQDQGAVMDGPIYPSSRKRIPENSVLGMLGVGDLQSGAVSMQGMIAFVMDCIQGLRCDDEITFSKEGLNGLWSFLLIAKEGIGEIEKAL